jgi:murein hydrolase activator
MIHLRAALLIALLAARPALASSDPSTLARMAMDDLNAAHLALNQATRASDRVQALSQTIRAFEDGLDALREGLRRAALRQAAIAQEFDAESEKLSRFLGVMMSIQSASGPLALLHPAGPIGTARSGMIVSEITPAIRAEAEDLRAKLKEVALLRALQESAADTLQQGLAGVQQARTDLSQAISNRTDLPKRYLSDPAQLQSLIDSAETLDGFASGLAGVDVGATVTDPVHDFQAARGTLPLPVAGTVLRRFNEPDAAGVKRPGLLLATRPLALVTTPWAATLRYRGPLLDYGNVIILEPDAGVLLVLAGLDQVYGEVGQVLPPNAPLGLMGGASPDADRFFQNAVNGAGSEQTETLYMELRVGAQPVDPANWFAQTKE